KDPQNVGTPLSATAPESLSTVIRAPTAAFARRSAGGGCIATVYSRWDGQVPRASKMSSLDPYLASGRTGARFEGPPHREAQPGLRLESLAPLFEGSFEHQEFHTAGIGKRDGGARRPVFEANVFVGILEQGHQLDARAVRRSEERHLTRVETHVCTVLGGELPELHEQNTTRRRARRVRGGGWVADVRAHRVLAVLVLEHAFEHQELLAAAVPVRGEVALRCVADDRGGSRNLLTDSIQHAPLDATHGRGNPGNARRVDRGTRREICVQVHGRP